MNRFNNMPIEYRQEGQGFINQDSRFLPFLAGAALAAPLFWAAGRPCPTCVVPVPTYPYPPQPYPYPPQPYPYPPQPYPYPYPYPYPLPTPYRTGYQSTGAAVGAGDGNNLRSDCTYCGF